MRKSSSSSSLFGFAGSRRWTTAEASTVLAALRSSGLSVGAFARRERLCAQRLRQWKKKLASNSERPIVPARSDFVEVVRPSLRRETIEVALPSGVVLRVPENVDVTALRRIVDALEGERGEPAC